MWILLASSLSQAFGYVWRDKQSKKRRFQQIIIDNICLITSRTHRTR